MEMNQVPLCDSQVKRYQQESIIAERRNESTKETSDDCFEIERKNYVSSKILGGQNKFYEARQFLESTVSSDNESLSQSKSLEASLPIRLLMKFLVVYNLEHLGRPSIQSSLWEGRDQSYPGSARVIDY